MIVNIYVEARHAYEFVTAIDKCTSLVLVGVVRSLTGQIVAETRAYPYGAWEHAEKAARDVAKALGHNVLHSPKEISIKRA